MLQLEAPAYVKYGDQIHLKCDFDLGGKTLYRYRQYSIVQYSTGAVQYSTASVQYSTVQVQRRGWMGAPDAEK